MSWSTSAPTLPTGASWSDWAYGSQGTDNNYYYYRAGARIARGVNNTVYVAVRLQVKGRTYGTAPGTISLNARVGGAVSTSKSSSYTCSGAYGEFSTAKTVYYTGTAQPGGTIWADAMWNSSDTGNVSMTVPAYVTTFTITFNGNGAEAGTMTVQTKTYGTALTLSPNDYIRQGYAFDHWNTAADDTGTSYPDQGSYDSEADATLYAQWVRTNIPVFVNVGGTIHQVDQAYANVGGVIKECQVYANVGGVIKAII